MMTNPNTVGLFDPQIGDIAGLLHDRGGLLYLDGANMNAILGIVRPGDMGVDLMHYNPHKTFSGPHGGGGPGAGPIAVRDHLAPYLPAPVVARAEDGSYRLDHDRPKSIGRVRSFFGNTGVLFRAYCYIRSQGPEGLKRVAQHAVLNANYLMHLVQDVYPVHYHGRCMHEFVASARSIARERGIRAMDIAKRLIDYNFHAPTVYFPLIVPEAIMIEPTETESRETLETVRRGAPVDRRGRPAAPPRRAPHHADQPARRGQGRQDAGPQVERGGRQGHLTRPERGGLPGTTVILRGLTGRAAGATIGARAGGRGPARSGPRRVRSRRRCGEVATMSPRSRRPGRRVPLVGIGPRRTRRDGRRPCRRSPRRSGPTRRGRRRRVPRSRASRSRDRPLDPLDAEAPVAAAGPKLVGADPLRPGQHGAARAVQPAVRVVPERGR